MAKKRQIGLGEYVSAIAKVGVRSFKIAPSAATAKITDSLIQAVLPIATTYFAAKPLQP